MEDVKGEEFIYLTTKGRRTGKPHTVELWFAVANRMVYLSHEGKYTDWMRNLEQDGSVGVRVDGVTLKGVGRIVKEGGAREAGKKALYEKYYGPASREVIDDWFELSTVVEVTLNIQRPASSE